MQEKVGDVSKSNTQIKLYVILSIIAFDNVFLLFTLISVNFTDAHKIKSIIGNNVVPLEIRRSRRCA